MESLEFSPIPQSEEESLKKGCHWNVSTLQYVLPGLMWVVVCTLYFVKLKSTEDLLRRNSTILCVDKTDVQRFWDYHTIWDGCAIVGIAGFGCIQILAGIFSILKTIPYENKDEPNWTSAIVLWVPMLTIFLLGKIIVLVLLLVTGAPSTDIHGLGTPALLYIIVLGFSLAVHVLCIYSCGFALCLGWTYFCHDWLCSSWHEDRRLYSDPN